MSIVQSTAVATLQRPKAENRQAQLHDFIKQSGFAEHSVEPLAGDASFRRYVRVITPQTSYVVMDSPPALEPIRPYIKVCDYLCKQGYSAPRIIALDEEMGFLLLEDLGNEVFNSLLEQNRKNPAKLERELYEQSVKLLAEWHKAPGMLKGTSTLKIGDYTRDEYIQELKLFTDWYLPELGRPEASFRAGEFLDIWMELLRSTPPADCYFVHRDFHANNLVWLEEREENARVGLLDFQDALWGDCSYDLASLIEDARRDVEPDLAADMKRLYVELTGQPMALFSKRYAMIAAQRNLKIIGIFARLNKRDGKPQYLDYLPRVWKYLEHDLTHPSLAKLQRWMDTCVPRELRK